MSNKMMNFDAFMKGFIERGYTLDEWLDEFRTVVSDVRALSNAIKASFIAGLMSAPTLAIGSGDKTAVVNGLFYYMIAGTIYAKAANTAGTEPGDDVIPGGTFGACAFESVLMALSMRLKRQPMRLDTTACDKLEFLRWRQLM